MSDPPPTRPSLLARIRDPRDGVAWGEFVDIYGPLVYDYGRRRGLQDADAADLTQDVLRAVAATADRFAYDPARGAFRSWLFTVTRTKLLDSVRRRRPGDRGTGDTDVHKHLEAEASRDSPMASTRARKGSSGTRRSVSGCSTGRRGKSGASSGRRPGRRSGCARSKDARPREASASLGMSIGAVYAAKCRVLARLREEIGRARRDGLPD